MTSKLSKDARVAGTMEKFPDFPPRDDMQNALHLHNDGHQPILRQHFGTSETIIILSPNPPNGVGRALEQDITGMERRPPRRIWDGRGQ